MTDDLQRLKSYRGLTNDDQVSEEEQIAGVCGLLRGIKESSKMLELRLKSGNAIALNYGWLDKAEYNPSSGITLHFGTSTVQVIGKGLNSPLQTTLSLFEGLLRHRITWIQESGQSEAMTSQTSVLVTAIRIH